MSESVLRGLFGTAYQYDKDFLRIFLTEKFRMKGVTQIFCVCAEKEVAEVFVWQFFWTKKEASTSSSPYCYIYIYILLIPCQSAADISRVFFWSSFSPSRSHTLQICPVFVIFVNWSKDFFVNWAKERVRFIIIIRYTGTTGLLWKELSFWKLPCLQAPVIHGRRS